MLRVVRYLLSLEVMVFSFGSVILGRIDGPSLIERLKLRVLLIATLLS